MTGNESIFFSSKHLLLRNNLPVTVLSIAGSSLFRTTIDVKLSVVFNWSCIRGIASPRGILMIGSLIFLKSANQIGNALNPEREVEYEELFELA